MKKYWVKIGCICITGMGLVPGMPFVEPVAHQASEPPKIVKYTYADGELKKVVMLPLIFDATSLSGPVSIQYNLP